ncbi:MAG: DUF6036 family nucleotidyltransferase [Planctomycetota bacterium]
MHSHKILNALEKTSTYLQWNSPVEILLIGGAAGMLTGQLSPERITLDCDVMHCIPKQAQEAILTAAVQVAAEQGLPENWLNSKAMQMNILPDGWQSRRVFIAEFGQLKIYAVGRLDLLAMKFFANRPQDREDIVHMKPAPDETDYIRKYLNMLRLPSRQADLDQVVSALKLVDAIEEIVNES